MDQLFASFIRVKLRFESDRIEVVSSLCQVEHPRIMGLPVAVIASIVGDSALACVDVTMVQLSQVCSVIQRASKHGFFLA